MMKFRTELIPRVSGEKIRLGDKFFLIGSCFADNIGRLLINNKFRTLLNPFGIIYNPVSIFSVVMDSLTGNKIDDSGLFETRGIFRHFDFHSDIAADTREDFYRISSENMLQTKAYLEDTDWIIFSFGTSIVYEHNRYRKVVANCHKLPGTEFNRRMLPPEEIIAAFDSFYRILEKLNSRARIILTVSPVRHLRSTLEDNSISKAILRYTAGRLSTVYSRVDYFPSFEIMMDDLRDYRFYKQDLVHPNDSAIEYIWGKFQEAYFDQEAATFVKDWTVIRKAIEHVPFFPQSEAHQEFLRKTIAQIRSFGFQVDVNEELRQLEKQLI